MNVEELRDFCLSFDSVSESSPFGDDNIVFKVSDKMFALVHLEPFEKIAVKCDPDIAVELRERYQDVEPAYHFNKKHWNDIYVNRTLTDEFIKKQIINSYDLVTKKLLKKGR